ncbi:acyltransferase family protein [Pseudomonas sp. NPDC088444]|uniref:acyltransferase family protein n=1 Tax=Pseudomonas sp. NPDC088444 TaxID=3364456 RepID=UPI00384C4E14
MKRFLVLDSFRGLCALSVAIYHVHILQSFGEWAFFRNAHYLVSFFFVLSGFVMFHTYGQRLTSSGQFRQFFITRTFRLYPLHVFVLLLAIGLEVMKWGAEHAGVAFNQGSFTGQRAPREILPNLFLLQSWWPGFNAQSFNYPAWSISVEYYLYMIFAAILLFIPRLSQKLFLGISLVATLLLLLQLAPMMEPALEGLSCFFAGVLTYRLYQRIQGLSASCELFTLLEAIGLLLVGVVMVMDIAHKQILLMLLFCIVIMIFSFEAGRLSDMLKARPFERLGTLSYSIYMTHAMILFAFTLTMLFVGKIIGHGFVIYPETGPGPLLSFNSALLNNLLLVFLLIVIVGLSSLSHRFIEQKGIQWGKRWAARGQGTSPLGSAKSPG